jgi:hypothetical protein
MKKLLTILSLFALTNCFGQYCEWKFEDRDSLYRQYNEVWESWDYYRQSENYSPAEMAKYRALGEWCGYKIECYLDSVQTEYNAYLIGGQEYFRPITDVDPGFYQGYQGVRKVTEHRDPTFHGFMQYKLERKDWWLLLTPYIRIPKN